MNESSNNSEKTPLSDEKMDALLMGFFRLETPAALNQAFRSPVMRQQSSAVEADAVTRPAVNHSRQIRGRGLVVTGALCTLAVALLVSLRSPESGKQSVSESRPAPVVSPPDLNINSMMMVSPQGDLKSATQPLSDDGTTLEETDSIELRPKK